MNRARQLLTLLSGGGGAFAQANPQTGTLYTGTSDGVFVWTLSYPASPDYLDQLRGGWRVQDLQSGGLGLVNNGWEWRLEYQTDGTWTFTWYSVTTGTAAAAIYTQANIGTVTNIRVTLSGASITVESSANNGSSYTARGNTTSATYQSNAGISASYTGATGAQLVSNGDFAAGSTGWDISQGPTFDFTGGSASIDGSQVTNEAIFQVGIGSSQIVVWLTVTRTGGQWNLSTSSTTVAFSATAGVVAHRVPQSGLGSLVLRARNDFAGTFDNVSAYNLGSLDSIGDGGFSLVGAA